MQNQEQQTTEQLKQQYNAISDLALQMCVFLCENKDFETLIERNLKSSSVMLLALSNITESAIPSLSVFLRGLYYYIYISKKHPEDVIRQLQVFSKELLKVNGLEDQFKEFYQDKERILQ
jgi:hypothetical protein